MSLPRYIAIEGVIGAGKTTLATRLAAHYGTDPLLEAFTDNVFLPRFYADPARYALPVELHFLTDRYQQLQGLMNTPAGSTQVADYTFAKCLLFARVTLPPEEAALFARLYEMARASLPRPDRLIYLHAGTGRLQHSIRSRGREYEQAIPDTYLENLSAAYEAWLPTAGCPAIWVDTGTIDYLEEAGTMQRLTQAVEADQPAGVWPFTG